jgi:hypothetical protein
LITVERELSRVRGEIEQLEAQLRHLNDQIALSTVTVSLVLPAEVSATVESGSWIGGIASNAAALFVGIGKALVAFCIYLLVLLPFIALFVGLAKLATRAQRKK